MSNTKTQIYLFIVWLIVLSAMLVTLYGSEILHQPVCHLCWYQRICLYPLVFIVGVAAYRNDPQVIPNIIVLPILGFLFALDQYLEQMIPGFNPIKFCTINVPCSTIHFDLFGFITYPFLSMLCCLIIFTLLLKTNSLNNKRI